MKRFLTLIVTILLFFIALALGLKNQQLITFNYLIAQSEMQLSTLLAATFLFGFIFSAIFMGLFYLQLKIRNRQLRKLNKKQRKKLDQLRTLPLLDKD